MAFALIIGHSNCLKHELWATNESNLAQIHALFCLPLNFGEMNANKRKDSLSDFDLSAWPLFDDK